MENLAKCLKVSKHYDHGCLQNLLLLFMSLLTVPILRKVMFWLEFTLYFFKKTCEIANYRKSAISIFLDFFASNDKIFILGQRRSTNL